MKKGKLGVVDKTFIESKFDSMSVDEIASLLDRSPKTISNYIDNLRKLQWNDKKVEPETTEAKTEVKGIDGIARGDNFAVMTSAASDMVDLAAKIGRTDEERRRDTEDYIYRPKG